MRKLGLKNQLHVVIVLLVISFVLIIQGCGLKGGKPSVAVKTFYPEYYAARQLSNEDIVKLRELQVSSDLFIADSATLLLGSYYLYYGDKNYGRILIDRSYESKNLDEEMRLFGKLWKMESLVVDNKKDDAVKIAEEVKGMKKDQTYMRVMQIYCNQLGVAVDSDEKVNECIDTALAGKEKFSDIAVYVNSESILPVNTDNMTYEEYLQAIGIGTDMSSLEEDVKEEYDLSQIGADAKINIVGGDIFDDIVTGMFYAMNKYGNTYQLEPISEYAVDEENKSSMVLKTNNYDLFIGGMKSNIGVNWLKLSDIALDFNMVKNKDIVVFLSSDKNIQFARLMAGSLKEKKKKAYVVNLKGNYQIELQNILTDKGDYRYTIVIMCNEKDLAKIVPVTKFWKLGRGHEILAITDLVGDIELTDEEKKYLQGIYILTGANLNENKNYNVISEEYKNDNKMPMTSKSALGFDIISYINSILNPEKEVKYVTNIKGIVNGYAVRNPVLLYVGEKGYIKKQEYDVPLIPEVEGDNSTDNMTDNKSTTLNKGE